MDVRYPAERRRWYIPGSEAALDPIGPLDHVVGGQDVVLVSHRGGTARRVAAHLRREGVQAAYLDGGMVGWTSAWNLAETHAAGCHVVQVRRVGKGCLSYVIARGDEAIVVDPSVDQDVYVRLAECLGARVTHVVDTHLHSDHLSRARGLAQATGAVHAMAANAPVTYAVVNLADGDTLPVGDRQVLVRQTPGHTWDSIALSLGDVLFTGDTLHAHGVGHVDASIVHHDIHARVHALHESVDALQGLGDRRLLPGHAEGPPDFQATLWGTSVDVLTRRAEALRMDEATFVARAMAGPDTAASRALAQANRMGAWPVGDLATLEASRCGVD